MNERGLHIKLLVTLLAVCFASLVFGQSIPAFSQDTISISLSDAQQRLVKKNLTLLINYYNVDIAKANYLQSKLWYNPNFSYNTTLYNQEQKKFFDNKYPNENAVDNDFQLQQLFTLAGRHRATWKLAQVGVKQAQYQVADILRNLKYELITDMSDLYNNQTLVNIYQKEETKIGHLVDITKILYSKGNAAGEDVVRLEAQYRDVMAQELTSRQAIDNDEQDLRIILDFPAKTYLVSNLTVSDSISLPNYQSIMDSAQKNRPDLLLAQAGNEYAQKNLKLQRVTGVPDLTMGISDIGAGSVIPNYWGINANIDLPVFNHNQWNIASAKYALTQSEEQDSLASLTVQSQVVSAYLGAFRYNKQMKEIPPDYKQSLEDLINNAFTNYEKRYISILDFLSELSTYLDGRSNLLNLQVQYFNAIHNVNLATGVDIIK
jgi:cobalt-zinc-cadmium efflux system outer membrane protein